MKRRWSFVLPILGLLLFAMESYESVRSDALFHNGRQSRFFWWSAIRLDSDPHNNYGIGRNPSCTDNSEPCIEFDEQRWVDPGLISKAAFYPALPAFVAGALVVHILGRLGVNQVITFFVSMPLLIFAWFYFAGWLLDRWRYKRARKEAARTA